MDILSVTLPILLLVAAGWLLKSKGVINADTGSFLSKLVYYFAFPALTFRSIVSFDFAGTFRLKLVAQNMLTTVIIFTVTIIPALLLRERRKRGSFHMGCFRSNQGYMGLPVIQGFYGREAMSRAAVVNGFDSFLVILLSVLALEIYRGNGQKYGNTGGSALPEKSNRKVAYILARKLGAFTINPFVLSSLLGLIFSYFAIPVLKIGVLDGILKMGEGMALPLAVLSVGCSIEVRHIKENIGLILSTAGIKLIIMPAAALILSWLVFGLKGAELGMSVILVATPTSISSYVMANEMDSDGELSAAIIGFTTFMSVLTITVIQLLLKIYCI